MSSRAILTAVMSGYTSLSYPKFGGIVAPAARSRATCLSFPPYTAFHKGVRPFASGVFILLLACWDNVRSETFWLRHVDEL